MTVLQEETTVLGLATEELRGRVAVVTGGAQGIGRALATAFAISGAAIVVADVDVERAGDVSDGLTAAGATAIPLAVDVADEVSTKRMAAEVEKQFGRLDVLVNNAAVFSTLEMHDFEDIDLSEWRRVIDVNLTGVFLCCRAVVPGMRKRGRGAIINLSSSTVLFGRPRYLHYVASKAGVVGLTRAMAREVGPDGITVNTIMPGSVATEVERSSVTPEQARAIVDGQSIQRRLVPDDIVGAATFLASDRARAISGQTLVVDGGSHFV
jgi:3-oxoacyl-[acyl-carrier protein] reductase